MSSPSKLPESLRVSTEQQSRLPPPLPPRRTPPPSVRGPAAPPPGQPSPPAGSLDFPVEKRLPKRKSAVPTILAVVLTVMGVLVLTCAGVTYYIVSSFRQVATETAERVNEEQRRMEREMARAQQPPAPAPRPAEEPRPFVPPEPFGGPVPTPPEPPPPPRDEFAENLKLLQHGNDVEKQRAASWFAQQTLDPDKQTEVSLALNGLDRPPLYEVAMRALVIWGTEENLPLIVAAAENSPGARRELLILAERFPDSRLYEPLVKLLPRGGDEGSKARELLEAGDETVDDVLLAHMFDADSSLRQPVAELLAVRKTDPARQVAQALSTISGGSGNAPQTALEWLEKQDVAAEQQPEVLVAVEPLLKHSDARRSEAATRLYCRYATKDQAKELRELLRQENGMLWKPALKRLAELDDAEAPKIFAERCSNFFFYTDAAGFLKQPDVPGEALLIKALPHMNLKEWGMAKTMVEVLGEIGTKKSLPVLNQAGRFAVLNKIPFVPDAIDQSMRKIRARE